MKLQSWTKVLATALQYSYFSVISRFPLKTVHPFRSFLAVLPPPNLYKVETRKKFWIHASNIVCDVRGGGWTCVHWKSPQKRKSVPGLLSMIHYWSQPCEICVKIFNHVKNAMNKSCEILERVKITIENLLSISHVPSQVWTI